MTKKFSIEDGQALATLVATTGNSTLPSIPDRSHTFIWDSEYGCPVLSSIFALSVVNRVEIPRESFILKLIPVPLLLTCTEDQQVAATVAALPGSTLQQMMGHVNISPASPLWESAKVAVDREEDQDDAFALCSSALSHLLHDVLAESTDKDSRASLLVMDRKTSQRVLPPVAFTDPVRREIKAGVHGITIPFSIYFSVADEAVESFTRIAKVRVMQLASAQANAAVDPATSPTTAHLLKGNPYGPH